MYLDLCYIAGYGVRFHSRQTENLALFSPVLSSFSVFDPTSCQPNNSLAQFHLARLTYPNTFKKPGDCDDEKTDVANPDEIFDQLVLPEGHKDLVKSLIAQHFRDKSSTQYERGQPNIVHGKGM